MPNKRVVAQGEVDRSTNSDYVHYIKKSEGSVDIPHVDSCVAIIAVLSNDSLIVGHAAQSTGNDFSQGSMRKSLQQVVARMLVTGQVASGMQLNIAAVYGVYNTMGGQWDNFGAEACKLLGFKGEINWLLGYNVASGMDITLDYNGHNWRMTVTDIATGNSGTTGLADDNAAYIDGSNGGIFW